MLLILKIGYKVTLHITILVINQCHVEYLVTKLELDLDFSHDHPTAG